MKITRLETWPVTMALQEAYAIAHDSVAEATNVFLRIETSSGVVGYGCAAPDPHVIAEHPSEVLDALEQTARAAIPGSDPATPRDVEATRAAASNSWNDRRQRARSTCWAGSAGGSISRSWPTKVSSRCVTRFVWPGPDDLNDS